MRCYIQALLKDKYIKTGNTVNWLHHRHCICTTTVQIGKIDELKMGASRRLDKWSGAILI